MFFAKRYWHETSTADGDYCGREPNGERSPAHEMKTLLALIVLFFAAPLFTLILSRLIFEEPMLAPQQPSLLMLVVTFAVSFSSYTSVAGRWPSLRVRSLISVCSMFAVLVPKLLRLRSGMPFHARGGP